MTYPGPGSVRRVLDRSDLVLVVGRAVAVALAGIGTAIAAPPIVAVTLIIFDGRSSWLEVVALIARYSVIAAAFWWGRSRRTGLVNHSLDTNTLHALY